MTGSVVAQMCVEMHVNIENTLLNLPDAAHRPAMETAVVCPQTGIS